MEYIKIGDKVTDLKQNNEFPNIAVDAESKTVIVTIDGQDVYKRQLYGCENVLGFNVMYCILTCLLYTSLHEDRRSQTYL